MVAWKIYYIIKIPTFTLRGVYGWNADIYIIGKQTCVCTGYRPFGNIKVNYSLVEKYDDKARNIILSRESYEIQTKKLDELLENFIKEALEK